MIGWLFLALYAVCWVLAFRAISRELRRDFNNPTMGEAVGLLIAAALIAVAGAFLAPFVLLLLPFLWHSSPAEVLLKVGGATRDEKQALQQQKIKARDRRIAELERELEIR